MASIESPATVSGLIDAALAAGATPLKPAAKSFWGYGGVVQAPDGTIWKVATQAKKDTGPATRQIDQIVLLLGAADVAASKRFYVCPRQGRRRLTRRHRIAPAHDGQRGRPVHRPGRVRVAGRTALCQPPGISLTQARGRRSRRSRRCARTRWLLRLPGSSQSSPTAPLPRGVTLASPRPWRRGSFKKAHSGT
jgi:hypothetical protein